MWKPHPRSVIFTILRDPGAAIRDDAIFLGKRCFQARDIFRRKFTSSTKEPLGTYFYQTSSRNFRICPADWPEKYFSCQPVKRSTWANLAEKNIFLANQQEKFEHFWNWFGKNRFPGALPPLYWSKLSPEISLARKYRIVPASSPRVSKDGGNHRL